MHRAGMHGTGVESHRENAHHPQVRIGPHSDLVDCFHQLTNASVSEGFALDGNEHEIGGDEGVDGEQSKRRRAIDDHPFVTLDKRTQEAS